MPATAATAAAGLSPTASSDRRAALIAAAALLGPAMPRALLQDRSGDAATAVTRMADLLLPWLANEAEAPSSTASTTD